MAEMQTTFGKLEVFFSGATVFSALILLGYLVVSGVSSTLNAIFLGVVVLLLALVIGLGSWYESRWLRLAAWPATFLLIILGFVGIAVGPQIISVAGFGLLSTLVMTVRDYRA